jgi:hypothetical protein
MPKKLLQLVGDFGERCEVLANRAGADVGAFVTVANLDELLTWQR